ncbi:MAG: hypothetical protein HQK93_10730 [Nitrospirae bacterium]|nr:hypothetical protein [Nitrospirota bacterium]
MRNFGNSAVTIDVVESANTYIFTANFIDVETGFTLQRAFRQAKKKNIGKKYDQDRAEDIIFQIGQSKAIRNVVNNAMPSWIINQMIQKAKENIIGRINSKGLNAAKQDTLSFFQRQGIEIERIEAKIGKKPVHWIAEDLALLHGAIRSLSDGQESAEELFPPISETKKSVDNPVENAMPAPSQNVTKSYALAKKNAINNETTEADCNEDPSKCASLINDIDCGVAGIPCKSLKSKPINYDDVVSDIKVAIDNASSSAELDKIMDEIDGKIQGATLQDICHYRDIKLRDLKKKGLSK